MMSQALWCYGAGFSDGTKGGAGKKDWVGLELFRTSRIESNWHEGNGDG